MCKQLCRQVLKKKKKNIINKNDDYYNFMTRIKDTVIIKLVLN